MVIKNNQNKEKAKKDFLKIIYPGGEYVGGGAGEGMTILPGVKPPEGSVPVLFPKFPRRRGGGGGRTPAPTPSAPTKPSGLSQAEIERISAEIERQRRLDIAKANKEYWQALRTAHDLDTRRKLLSDLQQKIANTQAQARLQRLEKGIVTSTTIGTTAGDIIVTKKNIGDIKKQLGFDKLEVKPKIGEKIEIKRTPDAVIGPFEPVTPMKPPLSIRLKEGIMERITGLGKLPTAISGTFAEVHTEAEKELAERGFLIPTREEQIIGGRRETLEFVPRFLTDKELESLSFGGLDELIKRQQKELDFNTRVALNSAQRKNQQLLDNEIKQLNEEFKEGKISQTELGNRLIEAEKKYKQAIEKEVSAKVDLSSSNIQNYINAVAKKQRVSRAIQLVPAVFTESYLLGLGFGAGIKGIATGARALGISGEATRLGISIGTLGLGATQIPKIRPLVEDFKKNPTAVTLEVLPAVTGFALGADPKIVNDLKNLGKNFVKAEKKLLADKRAKATTRTKQKQKLVQVKKSKKKVSFTAEDLKRRLKTANDAEIRKFISKLKDDKTLTIGEKQKLAALALEAKTGVPILDENFNIVKGQLREALTRVTVKKPTTTIPKPKVLRGFDRVRIIEPTKVKLPISKLKIRKPFSGLGVVTGRIPTGILGEGALNLNRQRIQNIEREISKIKTLIETTTSTIQKTSLLNRQELLQKQKQDLLQKQQQKASVALLSLTATAQQQLQKQRLKLSQISPLTGRRISPPKPRPPIITPRIEIPKPFSSRRKTFKKIIPSPKPKVAYYAEVKQRGKWRKILKQPLIEQQAKALAQITADKTIAASARIRPTTKYKKLAKISVKAPKQEKFRDYKIRKGQKIPIPNQWIEKRKYRLDTPKEKQTIQEFKKSAAFKKLLRSRKK